MAIARSWSSRSPCRLSKLNGARRRASSGQDQPVKVVDAGWGSRAARPIAIVSAQQSHHPTDRHYLRGVANRSKRRLVGSVRSKKRGDCLSCNNRTFVHLEAEQLTIGFEINRVVEVFDVSQLLAAIIDEVEFTFMSHDWQHPSLPG